MTIDSVLRTVTQHRDECRDAAERLVEMQRRIDRRDTALTVVLLATSLAVAAAAGRAPWEVTSFFGLVCAAAGIARLVHKNGPYELRLDRLIDAWWSHRGTAATLLQRLQEERQDTAGAGETTEAEALKELEQSIDQTGRESLRYLLRRKKRPRRVPENESAQPDEDAQLGQGGMPDTEGTGQPQTAAPRARG